MKKYTYEDFLKKIKHLSNKKNSEIKTIKDFCEITGYLYQTVLNWRPKNYIPYIAMLWLNEYENNLGKDEEILFVEDQLDCVKAHIQNIELFLTKKKPIK